MGTFLSQIYLIIVMFLQPMDTHFIRPNSLYQQIIKEVCNYYYCNSVNLFYSNGDHINNQGIEDLTNLKKLLVFLNEQLIRTSIVNVDKITQDNIQNLGNLRDVFLVFLDDSWDLRYQFQQLAPAIDMSDPIWLVFLQSNTDIYDYFDGVNIPFDCRFMVSQKNASDSDNGEIITEIYRVWKDKELRHNAFGSWSSITGIQLPNSTLYKRRNSLHGHTLRSTTAHWPPLTLLTVDEKNETKLIGSTGNIVTALQQNMNFTSTLLVTNAIGSRLKNGTWVESIGNLIYDRADISFLFFQMSHARSHVIDYTIPLYQTPYYFFFRKPKTVFSWDAFLLPFHRNIWITITCTVLVSSALMRFILNFYQRKFPRVTIHEKELTRSNILLSVLGSFCNQAMPRSSIDSIAMIQYTVYFTAIIMYAIYSGVLISSLMIDNTLRYQKSLEEILNDKDYKVGTLRNSGLLQTLKTTENKLLIEIYEKRFLPNNLSPSTHQEGIDRVCSENFMYLATSLYVFNLKKADCVVRTSECIFEFSHSIALSKNSPFREFFNQQINLLRDNGALNKWLGNWVRKRPLEEVQTEHSVDIFEVFALFAFLGGNLLLSSLFLSWEKFLFKKWNLRRPPIGSCNHKK